jgi:hypothetical protein
MFVCINCSFHLIISVTDVDANSQRQTTFHNRNPGPIVMENSVLRELLHTAERDLAEMQKGLDSGAAAKTELLRLLL